MTTATESADPELIGISYSPWTERARWALDHQKLPYRFRELLVLFGMPWLRMKTRKWTGDLTVPVLLGDGVRALDSWDIAEYADRVGHRSGSLFPVKHAARIRSLHDLSERCLSAGRNRTIRRTWLCRESWPENVPELIPGFLRRVSVPLVGVGLKYLWKEFETDGQSEEESNLILRDALLELRSSLNASGGRFLLGEFSFADITSAMILQFVSPVDGNYLKIGQLNRQIWGDARLASEFADLIAWRDGLYREFRATGSGLL